MDKRDRRRHKIFMRGIYQNMVIFKRWTVDMVDIWYPGQDPMTYHSYHYRVIKNIEKWRIGSHSSFFTDYYFISSENGGIVGIDELF